MELGLITTQIKRPTIETLFKAIADYSFKQIQLNFSSFSNETMPKYLDPMLLNRICAALEINGLKIAAISGTYNMIHSDINIRKVGLERLQTLAQICKYIDCNMITLCTGTRSDDMWTFHPDNNTKEAWNDLTHSMESVLKLADQYQIFMGVEPEITNVMNSVAKTRRLLDEMQSPWLKVVMDGANLFHPGEAFIENVKDILKNAFDQLGKDIGLAHGKDILPGEEILFTSAGRGIIDFDFFFRLLKEYGYKGGMILHGMKDENECPVSAHFLRKKMIDI